jgi:radical SAM superfamily enzyme YgiQ (UPF0313 family)
MNLLFVSPCSEKEVAELTFLSPPLGVVRLAGFLSARGHNAEYYDPNLHMITGDGPSFDDVLTKTEWDYIGFSVLEETLENDLMGMYHAKKLCPGSNIIAGGIEAQFNYQTILDKSPCELVVIGEGEIPLLKLADGEPLQDIPGIVFKSNARPLSQELFNEATSTIQWEALPYEEYWNFYLQAYGDKLTPAVDNAIRTVRVFSRNRCPIGCKYCSSTNQLTWGSDTKVPVISADEDNLITVVERVVASHPDVKTIYFTDDDFCINKRSVIRFCEKVVEKDFGDLTFLSFARITDLSEEMVKWMSKANFRQLNIGVENFSQTVLEEVGKICDADRIHAGLALLKKYGIEPYFNIILITPQTTIDDIELTIDTTMYYVLDEFFHAGIISAIVPLKGTEFAEMYSDYKTHLRPLEGTNYTIKKEEMIWAEDPIVRELQKLYTESVDEEVGRRVREEGIVHKSGQNVALIKLRYMKQLILEMREKHGLPPGVAVQRPEGTLIEQGVRLSKVEPVSPQSLAASEGDNSIVPDRGFGHF